MQHLAEHEIPPVKFFFGAKHENSGKIESHLIFFKGFCCNSNPSYCQVIDAGTIPNAKSITSLVKALDREPQCAGIAGEIEVFTPTNHELGYGIHKVTDNEKIEDLNFANKKKQGGLTEEENRKFEKKDNKKKYTKLVSHLSKGKYTNYEDIWYEDKSRNFLEKFEAFFIILAQFLEYKISHYVDKSFESTLGFISVLPGAFSMFRWEAVQGEPLKQFFYGMEKEYHSAKEANKYLAEDRIM